MFTSAVRIWHPHKTKQQKQEKVALTSTYPGTMFRHFIESRHLDAASSMLRIMLKAVPASNLEGHVFASTLDNKSAAVVHTHKMVGKQTLQQQGKPQQQQQQRQK